MACNDCNHPETLREVLRKWALSKLAQPSGHNHHDHDHGKDHKGPCDYKMDHVFNHRNKTVLTLVYDCDGLIGYNESESIERGRELGEEIMALYDIEKIT